jgi:hypothetical protein
VEEHSFSPLLHHERAEPLIPQRLLHLLRVEGSHKLVKFRRAHRRKNALSTTRHIILLEEPSEISHDDAVAGFFLRISLRFRGFAARTAQTCFASTASTLMITPKQRVRLSGKINSFRIQLNFCYDKNQNAGPCSRSPRPCGLGISLHRGSRVSRPHRSQCPHSPYARSQQLLLPIGGKKSRKARLLPCGRASGFAGFGCLTGSTGKVDPVLWDRAEGRLGSCHFGRLHDSFTARQKDLGYTGNMLQKGGMEKRPLSAHGARHRLRVARQMFKWHSKSKDFPGVESWPDGWWSMPRVWRDRRGQIFQIR